jgi:hypothetical protein
MQPTFNPPPTFTPLRDYTGYHHVLGASACFVHPLNGNIYFWACEQKAGKQQNLTIYREMGSTQEWQTVVTFQGTVDADSFIERGGCVIGQGGALIVATTLQPKGVPYVTTTGFQGVRCRIPKIDEPWSMGLIAAQVAALNQRVLVLETALANSSAGGLDAKDREALDRLIDMLRL